MRMDASRLDVHFICPKCNGEKLGVVVHRPAIARILHLVVTDFGTYSGGQPFGILENDEEAVDDLIDYRCMDCRYVLPCADHTELYTFLKDGGMIEYIGSG